MKIRDHLALLNCGLLLFAQPALTAAETTIENTNAGKFAFGANIGWINMRPNASVDIDNTDGGDGATVRSTYLQGRVYSANCGWITLGDLDGPANGHAYANSSNTDYGVNLQNGNRLVGYAYGANIGWINFGNDYPVETPDEEYPQINLKTGQLSGYAYGANIGWINLGDGSFHVVTEFIERPDTDNDGIDDVWEYQQAGNLTTLFHNGNDADKDGQSDVTEFLAGTDPLNQEDRFVIMEYAPAANYLTADLTFTSNTERLYQLVFKESMGDDDWTLQGDLVPGNPGSTTLSDVPTGYSSPDATSRYFRVITALPLLAEP